jgi:hypothetical protein
VGLKVNARKSSFCQDSLEYLGYLVTREGIQPIPKKVEAILNLAKPTNRKEVRRFIGMVNYYRDMWPKRSEILAPLSRLTSKNVKFEWTKECQKAFDDMKWYMAQETLLVYPDFTKEFQIHTDASHTQLGAVISQDGRPIAFYSRKLTDAQTRYTTTERELLAIVETLKEFRNILLGQKIIVFTDHQNLTYKNFNTERVMRWRLILEEFGPELRYLKGEHNTVADGLSRLQKNMNNELNNFEFFVVTRSGRETRVKPGRAIITRSQRIFVPSYYAIGRAQKTDEELRSLLKTDPKYVLRSFHGGDSSRSKLPLITYNERIVVPKTIQADLLKWYHEVLCHPGMNRTEETIRQNFTWRNLRDDVQKFCKTCDVCQRTKRDTKNYGHLPEKEAESLPWEKLCVDLIGPYSFKRKNGKILTLQCVTMIDPATCWFEMREIKEKSAITVANNVEKAWLTRYPKPMEIVYDQGNEFLGEFANMIENDYDIKKKPITKRNPQANAIIERVHQTIGNMIRTFEINKIDLDMHDPWSGILHAVMFAIRATVHTTLKATPMQLVFGRDAILNKPFNPDWDRIKENKQKVIAENNRRENAKRIPHNYKKGDYVLVKTKSLSKYGQDPYEGPYKIRKVNKNGTVIIKRGVVLETLNIRLIKPYNSIP